MRETTSKERNAKHANLKKKQSASTDYQRVKEEYEALRRKPNKSQADIKELARLEKQKKHFKEKADWSGEHHSQNKKGS